MENVSDETNAFSVHFKTVPGDSTGVAHILEHVTLCGSQRFPVRDPFMKMLNRSLASMNAMTGPDFTLYPFSTPNPKDYYNLLQVYLDAVFRPLLREVDFFQEGWRLDVDSQNNLGIKGVVFNEMKGVFADAQQVFAQEMLNSLLPSHTYGNCSGGLPEKIPSLTWSDLRQFHSVHYSPDNARFYTYGNLPLEGHLKAVSGYLPAESSATNTVPCVPKEPRWTSPRRKHIDCPKDDAMPNTTLAVSYLLCDIDDTYETFVLRVIGELLTEGPSAPFYKSLIETGLGTGFAPTTGYDAHTKDTLFSVGLQGIDMDRTDVIEKEITRTFERVFKEGFEPDRVQAILNKTELALKQQVDDFGWKLILSLTPGWNHVANPIELLQINKDIDRFKTEIQNPEYLKAKVKQYFVENQHQLVLTMSPKENYLEEKQQTLDELEKQLVDNLSEEAKARVTEQGKILAEQQSTKESEETIACLPSLSISDMPDTLPKYSLDVVDSFPKHCKGQLSIQPTNGVAYFRARLSTAHLNPEEQELLPLLFMILTSMGAGEKSYREMDTQMELYTGGMTSACHLAESPDDKSLFEQRGLLISSSCLERNSDKMFDLWANLFHGVLMDSDKSLDTQLSGLRARLMHLISMSAVDAMNGLAHSGHHYAMSHAASKLQNVPAAIVREKQGGITMVRLLNKLAAGGDEEAENLLTSLASLARAMLNQTNVEAVSLNTTQDHVVGIVGQCGQFLQTLPIGSDSKITDEYKGLEDVEHPQNTYIATPFPIHYCSAAMPTAHYTHEDSAPLRVLSRLLSSKFLHGEIREKGGAYGGGASSNPTSGIFSFYSYRDPNCEATLDTFEKSNEWVQGNDQSFRDRDIDEAKLGVFKAVDRPVLPGARGQRLFLSGITDEMFEQHRQRLRQVTREDLLRVSDKYLSSSSKAKSVTVIGPESSAKNLDNKSWTVQQLMS